MVYHFILPFLSFFQKFNLSMDGTFSFTRAERLVVTSQDVSNLCKSWIVFRAFGLCDGFVRARILTGFKPWRIVDQFNCFSFNPQFITANDGQSLSLTERKEQWLCFMDRWCEITLFSPEFEIVDTATMGLGIVARHGISVSALAEKLHGFLEFVSIVPFRRLQKNRYNSLYQYRDEDDNLLHCVLFGPLSLVNSNLASSVAFYNADAAGSDLCWQVRYESHTVEEAFYDEQGHAMIAYHRYRNFTIAPIAIAVGNEEEDFPVEEPHHGIAVVIGMDALPVLKYSLFYRVSFFYHGIGVEKVYVAGEEVFISYPLNDMLV